MSRPAVKALAARDHIVGPPGSGKTAALAAEIDATLRAGANPYLLAVITPSEAGAEALHVRGLLLAVDQGEAARAQVPGEVQHAQLRGVVGAVEHALAAEAAAQGQAVQPTHQLVAAPYADEARRPAGGRLRAAVGVQRLQVGVAHEGRGLVLLRQQPVPGCPVQLGGVIMDADNMPV